MKRIQEHSNTIRYSAAYTYTGSGSGLPETVEDHQSNQEPPEDHLRDQEDQRAVHERIHGRHLG